MPALTTIKATPNNWAILLLHLRNKSGVSTMSSQLRPLPAPALPPHFRGFKPARTMESLIESGPKFIKLFLQRSSIVGRHVINHAQATQLQSAQVSHNRPAILDRNL